MFPVPVLVQLLHQRRSYEEARITRRKQILFWHHFCWLWYTMITPIALNTFFLTIPGNPELVFVSLIIDVVILLFGSLFLHDYVYKKCRPGRYMYSPEYCRRLLGEYDYVYDNPDVFNIYKKTDIEEIKRCLKITD